jgi:large subunit ribosomal protein L24
MKIIKGDTVIVTVGADKGKTGKVLKAFPADNKVVVDGVNKKKVHERTRKSGSKGQIVEKIMPISVSNVAIVDPKTNKASRVGKKFVGEVKNRIAVKSGSTLGK